MCEVYGLQHKKIGNRITKVKANPKAKCGITAEIAIG
jgi:hypothetical protein